jgi:carboxymethylenebutenolidase
MQNSPETKVGWGPSEEIFGQKVDSMETKMISALGFLAKPKKQDVYPGIVMIHQWWGLDDSVKYMAKLLAKEGYVVLAVDLYGEVAKEPKRAGELAAQVRNNEKKAIGIMKDAAAYLKDNEKVSKVASLGWCFGGGQSLLFSLNEPLDATVIYYGTPIIDEKELRKLKVPVLAIFGSEDKTISVSSVNNFRSALNNLKIKNEIHIYPGVGHAFANPGSNYAMQEAKDAWGKTLRFLDNTLKHKN